MAVIAAGLSLNFAVATNAVAAEKAMYTVMNGESIPKSLTGKAGDAKNGRKLAIHRKKGNCLACHEMPIPEQAFHGKVGPSLKGIASRMSEGEMRLRIVNPKVANEDTIMPAFYKKDGFTRVLKKFKGKTMLSAAQIEDIIAYLNTLK
ncbi:MAG: sulfur oxidation c-type cytochrome SoxX [Rhodospirillales bacterium]